MSDDYNSLAGYTNRDFLKPQLANPNISFNNPGNTNSILDPNSFAVREDLFDPNALAFNADALQLGNGVNDAPESAINPKTGAFSNYVIPGLDTLSGLTQAYTGYKALQLSEDQFDLSRDQYNRNMGNQAQVFNMNLYNSHKQGLGDQGLYDTTTPEGRAAFQKDLDSFVAKHSVDGSAL